MRSVTKKEKGRRRNKRNGCLLVLSNKFKKPDFEKWKEKIKYRGCMQHCSAKNCLLCSILDLHLHLYFFSQTEENYVYLGLWICRFGLDL